MKARLSEEQIMRMLKEHECGQKAEDICRRHGLSTATFYKYKSKYGGLETWDLKRLRSLEVENGRLKKLLADAILDNAILRDVASKKW